MGNILNICRMLFKNRKHERYNVQSGTFVLVAPGSNGERKVQIVDISMGGAAFIYFGRPEELVDSGIVNILTNMPNKVNLEFDTVSDVSMTGIAQPSDTLRRRGVKFKWMGIIDKAALRKFIEDIGIFYT